MPRAPSLQAALAPLDTTGRVQAAADRLRRAIVLGLVRDGEQLPAEAELAAQLRVSTMTLRETLAILRQEGLLQTRRGRGGGTFVCAPPALTPWAPTVTLDEVRELADEWAALAGAAAALAAQRASAAEVDLLDARAEEFAAADDVLGRRRADWRFHMQLAAVARSVRLSRAEQALQGELADLLWRDGEPADDAARRHARIVAAVRAGDPARARRRAEEHVRAEMARVAGRYGGERPVPAGSPDAVLATLAGALADVFDALGSIRAVLLRRVGSRRLQRADLDALRDLLLGTLAELGHLICGTGVIVAPQVVPRLEWYWRSDPASAPRRLTVELDPASPSFYDYERAEWFTVPRTTGERWMTGPYVDFGGTDQHIVTLSLPLRARSGTFLGVVAADVRVSAFEPLLLGGLRSLGRPAALVDADRRVIVASDPRLLAGGAPRGEPAQVVGRPGLSWALALW